MTQRFDAAGKLLLPTLQELQEADQSCEIIAFTDGVLDDGSPYWVYMAVKPSRYRAFVEATRARRPIMLEEYGRILRYGFEPVVPTEIKAEMKREWGCDDDYANQLVRQAKADQNTFLLEQENKKLLDIVAMLKKTQAGA